MENYVILPLYIAGAGIIVSIIGTFMVSVKEGGSPQKGIKYWRIWIICNNGSIVMYLLITTFLPGDTSLGDRIHYTAMGMFWGYFNWIRLQV